MNGKLIYIASKGEYIFITSVALTPDIKDDIQADMSERLREQVSVISSCSSFEYIPPRVKTPKDWEDVK